MPKNKIVDDLYVNVLLPIKTGIKVNLKYSFFRFWSWLTEIPSLVTLVALFAFLVFVYQSDEGLTMQEFGASFFMAIALWIFFAQPVRILYELSTRKTPKGRYRAVKREAKKRLYWINEFDALAKEISDLGQKLPDSVYTSMDAMSGHEFEQYCAALLQKNGFTDVQVTQASGDYGIDVLAHKDGISYAIQCKCYSGNVGNDAVQQAYSGKSYYNAMVAVVMTNRYFTQAAKETAAKNQVLLWDRDVLNEMQHSLQTN